MGPGVTIGLIAAGFIIFVVRPWYQKLKHEAEEKEDKEIWEATLTQLPPDYVESLRAEGLLKDKDMRRD